MNNNEFEPEGKPMTNEELARYAIVQVLKFQLIKWAIIIGVTKALRRAAEKKMAS